MRQAEKLDRILRYLYDRKFDHKSYHIANVVNELRLPVVGEEESRSLGRRLLDDGLIMGHVVSRGRVTGKISSHGVDYCETSSYENPQRPLAQIQFTTISNSSNVVVLNNSPQAQVGNADSIEDLVVKVKNAAKTDASLSEDQRKDLDQLLKEVQGLAQLGLPPKSSIDALLSRFGNVASIGSLAASLAQMLVGG